MKKLYWMIALAGAAGLIAGCTPKYNVEVYMSPNFLETMKIYPSMEVDVVGLNVNEIDRIKDTPTDTYFEYDNLLRKGLEKCTLTFSADSVEPKLLPSGNDIWGRFADKDAKQLLLIVNVPGCDVKDAQKDPRKLILPMSAGFPLFPSTLYFELSPSGIMQLKKAPDSQAKPIDVTEKGKEK